MSGGFRESAVASLLTGTPVLLGGGDQVSIYNSTTGSLINLAQGTAASPDASANPPFKVNRTLGISSASFTGDGSEACAAIVGNTVGVTTNDGQAVGVFGGAKSSSTTVASAGGDDACGLYGVGRITGSGTGTGIGAFVAGRRDTNTGRANGLEVSCANYTATPGAYSSTGFSNTTGIWIECTGNSDSGVGISFGNPFGFQYDVGIAFNAQVVGGKTGAIISQSIRDDSSAATSLLINGTHATAGIAIASGSGTLVVGGTTVQTSTNLLAVISSGNADPLVQFGKTDANHFISVRVINSSGSSRWFVAAGANNGLTGTAAGDSGIIAPVTNKAYHIGGTVSVIKVTNGNALGFFNNAAVTAPAITGALSTVIDAAAKAVLTSIIAALKPTSGVGLVTDGTT